MTTEKMKKEFFGTNGVRGVVGSEMTPALALTIGLALGSMRPGRIAIGRDTRTSGPALLRALAAGLMAAGCDTVDYGILPTPALQLLVRGSYAAGAVITASHNPPEYNGVKVIEPDGTEMGDEETLVLEARMRSAHEFTQPWDKVGSAIERAGGPDEYVRAIGSAFPAGIGEGLTVVIDPGSGAACDTTPAILRRLGCRVFSLNDRMDGYFPGRLPEPSPEGLAALSRMVTVTGAAFGVAHDGDADRAVFIDNEGHFVEENAEFALIADHLTSQEKGVIVTPVSTSRLLEWVAEKNGCRVVYTPVGSIYVARTMRERIDAGEKVVFGGEGNGGLIYPGHQFCRDGGMTAAMMVALLATRKTTLSAALGTLPTYTMRKEKFHVHDPEELIARLAEAFQGEAPDLTDGVRINRSDTWALVRPSGTEPLVRIFVESKTREAGEEIYQDILALMDPSSV